MDYGEVLTRAWQITWKHKVLWIFGILAGCSRAGGGGGGGGGSGYSGSRGGDSPELERLVENFGQWIADHWWVVVLFVAAILLLALLSIFLGTIGRIGLIKGTLAAERGAEQMAFGELFGASLPYFWRVLGLAVMIGLAFAIVFIPMALFGVLTAGVGFVCLLPLICLLVPISIVVNIILEQANVAIVTEDLGVLDGLRRGWEVVRSNPGPAAVMAIILYVIGAAIGIGIALPILALLVPTFLVFGFNLAEQGVVSYAPLIVAGLCIAAYFPIALLANGILMTYSGSAWALTYLRLAKPKEEKPVALPTNA